MAGSVVNMIIMTFGWVFHNSIGMSLDSLWDGVMIDGVKSYSANNFITSITIIPAATTVAIIGMAIVAMVNVVHERRAKRLF